MDLGLKNRRAILTGGTRGIGRAIAEQLADEGASIAFCARDGDEVKDAVAALEAKGVRAIGSAVDVGDAARYKAWLDEAAGALGGVDIFIPNVSAGGGDLSEDAWRAHFDVDVMHTVRGCETLLPELARSGAGAVVIVGTIAAVETFISPTAYGALKAALLTYAKQMAKAVAEHGVRFNTVAPGPVYFEGGVWDRIKSENPDFFAQVERQCALGRFATPEDVARAVTFLASPAAGYITGTTLVVDGGFTQRVQF